MGKDFGLKGMDRSEDLSDVFARASQAAHSPPSSLSVVETAAAARAAAASVGFSSREARPSSGLEFEPPRKQKTKNRSNEPTWPLNMRPKISIVKRFNRLSDALNMSNPELLAHLLDRYERTRRSGEPSSLED